MQVSREEVLHCAKLVHIKLEEHEIEPMRKDMERLLNHAQSLNELDLDNVEPTLHGLDIAMQRRLDVPKPFFTQKEALQNAPKQDKGYFLVPKVM